MHVKKYLSIFLIGLAFAITGCSSGSSSGGLDRDPIEDIDGDGIADIVDPDMDGDGILNEQDPDDDNDGVEDSIDPTPPPGLSTKTCVAATILPPNDETFPGEDGELSWELLPQGCVLPATRANAGTGVTVRAAPQRTTGDPTSATANAGNCAAQGRNGNVQCFTKIKVPEGCGQFAVVYDISEVGDVLGDTDLSKGAYQQKVFHKGNACETGPEPDVACTSAIIQWPEEKLETGTKVKIRWTLLPEGCGLTDEKDIEVQATAHNSGADPKQRKSNKRRVGQFKTAIRIPHNCKWDPDPSKGTNIDSSVAIQYDFSALGKVLGDPAADTDTYTKKVNHQVGSGDEICEGNAVDPVVDFEFIVGPADEALTVNADGSVTGPGNAAVYAMANGGLVRDLKEPTWSSTPAGYMNIYITGVKTSIVIEGGSYYIRNIKGPIDGASYQTWEQLQTSEWGEESVRTDYQEVDGPGGVLDPIKKGGNFVLRLTGATFTLNQYSVN